MRREAVFVLGVVSLLVVICSGKEEVIHVGGKVMCQDCTQGWNQWVHGSTPIKGSRVAISCMDDRKRVIYYGSDEADEEGEFELTIDRYILGKEVKPNLCSVRLVSSPDPQCNLLTDFAGGKSGVKLTRPSHLYRDLIKYTLGPFYFTSPMCEEPDTDSTDHEYSHGGGNNY